MMTAAEQERLVRVGPGTPMGELLRRYWHPVAAACQLAAGATRRVRLLGEDLVLFRNAAGWGLVDERCPHRGASLAYGACEPDGLRCAYHGWKFAADGACLETPAEPPGSRLAERVRARAYPVAELGGLVFAYLGPAPAPLLPRYDLYVRPGGLRDIGQALIPCNWLQIMENSVDPTHVEWLHGHQLAHVRGDAPAGYLRHHERTAFEVFRHGILKRRLLAGGSEADDDWRVGHPLVFPCALRVGEHGRHRMQLRVPVDDTHTWHLWYAHHTFAPGVEVPAQTEVPLYDVPWRDAAGAHLVDFVDGQDIMTWVTQGAIADRTREQLGSSDKGIVLLRRLLEEQLDRISRGEDPLGVIRDPAENELIELPQERDKLGAGAAFRRQSLAIGHGRHSPLHEQILRSSIRPGRRSGSG